MVPGQVLGVKEGVEVGVVIRQLLQVNLVIEVMVHRHIELRHALMPIPLLPRLPILLLMVVNPSLHQQNRSSLPISAEYMVLDVVIQVELIHQHNAEHYAQGLLAVWQLEVLQPEGRQWVHYYYKGN